MGRGTDVTARGTDVNGRTAGYLAAIDEP